MPPFLYPIVHTPPPLNSKHDEYIPLKKLNSSKKQRDTEFYIPPNGYYTSCLSARLVSQEFVDIQRKEEEEKLKKRKKRRNKRDEFVLV
jgi:hypothetical protein